MDNIPLVSAYERRLHGLAVVFLLLVVAFRFIWGYVQHAVRLTSLLMEPVQTVNSKSAAAGLKMFRISVVQQLAQEKTRQRKQC